MSEIEILRTFKKNLVDFLDELVQTFPEEEDLVIGRVFVNDQIPIQLVMERFITHILPHSEMIQTRNEDFFVSGNHDMFGDLPQSKVIHWKRMWQSKDIDSDDRAVIWDYFNVFVTLAENYVKLDNP